MKRCRFTDSQGNEIQIKPDGIHDLDACLYEEVERIEHCTVIINKCKRCGHIEAEWMREDE